VSNGTWNLLKERGDQIQKIMRMTTKMLQNSKLAERAKIDRLMSPLHIKPPREVVDHKSIVKQELDRLKEKFKGERRG
jgi:hypothetical protein